LEINPFASSFRDAYASEKVDAQRDTGHPQLVWTLWKILRGDVDEVWDLALCFRRKFLTAVISDCFAFSRSARSSESRYYGVT
jgi:hypothetical protein